MRHPESKLQQSCVRWFRYEYPKALIFANANGGYRSKIEAAIMQAEGVLAGVPDLTIVVPGRVIWVEMKSETGKLTERQKDVLMRIESLDHSCFVCRSLEEFMAVCRKEIGQ